MSFSAPPVENLLLRSLVTTTVKLITHQFHLTFVKPLATFLKDLEDGAAFASAPSVVCAWATASVLETWSLVLELELIECFLSISKSLCLKLDL